MLEMIEAHTQRWQAYAPDNSEVFAGASSRDNLIERLRGMKLRRGLLIVIGEVDNVSGYGGLRTSSVEAFRVKPAVSELEPIS